MSTEIQKGDSILRPRARLIKTIGEELISNDIVAVLELIKNSYDADASIIEIKFSGEIVEVEESKRKKKKVLSKEGASITIVDDGSGMSLETIKSAWMEPATIMKKKTKTSPGKSRRYTGEKGIGRFASAKLSDQLEIITKIENDNEIVVDFDWTNFTDDEAYLDQVKCAWEVREPQEIEIKGTTLKLTQLNSDWDEEKFRFLRVTLSRLINPVVPVEDFLMELQLPEELEHLSGLVNAPDSINKPDYFIKGKVDNSGQATIEYSSRNETSPVSYTKDVSKELNPIRTPVSGPFNFEFRAWDRENDSLKRLAKEVDSTIKNVRADLNDLAGISIYRDKFRVLPYGEPKNDWLRLDLRRVNNPTLRLSSNQIIGYISVSLDDNPEFKDQSNREGIVDSQAFTDLQETIKVLLSEIEQKRYEERPRKEDPESSDSLFARFSISSLTQIVAAKLPEDKEVQTVLKDTKARIDDGVKKVQNVISRYRRLSTLGLLMDVVLHDGNNFLLRIDSEIRLLQKELAKITPDQDEVQKHLMAIAEQRKVLAQLFKRLEPFGGRKRGRPTVVVIENAIANIFQLYKTELSKLEIEIALPESENIIRIDEGELQMILINLLQNSLFWLEKQEDERKITIELERTEEELSIIFSDSGPGIEEKHANLIFDPYFSTKPDGIGLGLTIVGEIISEYDGQFMLVDNGPLDGATFKITFRRRI
jgi:signal transduction histidine kinase